MYRYILTADTSERTKCCLMSAHLFKVIFPGGAESVSAHIHGSYLCGQEMLFDLMPEYNFVICVCVHSF